ncbi:MAG TPA: hypothetical protein VID27_10310 [Blastocatellia bacterium]|jgi:hypothetical protein
MNHPLEEEKIRQLFHELREEDDQNSPSFASTLETALSKVGSGNPFRFAWHVAFVAASILLIIGLAFLILRQYSTSQQINPPSTDDLILKLPDRNVEPLPLSPEIRLVTPPKTIRKKSRPIQFEPSPMLISRWQSPTDFLLRTPGAEWLKGVPRITDSSIRLKSIPVSEKN